MIRSLREEAKLVYLAVRFGQPLPGWAISYMVAHLCPVTLGEAKAMDLTELRQALAVEYGILRAIDSEDSKQEGMGNRENMLRLCHAAVLREQVLEEEADE